MGFWQNEKIERQAAEIERLRAENEKLRASNRWNIEQVGDDLVICEGDHDKGDKCEYKRWFAEERVHRLRAENEKLRAATGSLVRSLSGCWYAFEPSLRREMGNTNYHCVKEKMDEVEALLDLRAAADALKED